MHQQSLVLLSIPLQLEQAGKDSYLCQKRVTVVQKYVFGRGTLHLSLLSNRQTFLLAFGLHFGVELLTNGQLYEFKQTLLRGEFALHLLGHRIPIDSLGRL